MCGLRDTVAYLLVEMCTLQVTLSGFCSRQGREVVDRESTTRTENWLEARFTKLG
jgi:hypothetical protein